MQQMYSCPTCGAQIVFGTPSCPNCRTPLNWPSQPQGPPPAYQQQAPPYQQQQSGYGEKPQEQKKRSPWLIGCLGLFGVVALFAGLICVIDTDSEGTPPTTPPATSPAASPPEPTQAPAIRTTCKQLTQECMDNEVAWDQKYKGKLVEVSGTLGAIDYEYVTLDSGLFLTDMHCSLCEGQESQLAQLVKGERITVRGICKTCGAFGVTLRDCVLVPSYEGTGGTEPEQEPVLVTKDASELVLTIGDFEAGWRQQTERPATREGAQSAYFASFIKGTYSVTIVENWVAVYPSVDVARDVYVGEKPKDVSLEYPNIGDECFMNIAVLQIKELVFRRSNVVVWVTTSSPLSASSYETESYARVVEQKITP